MTLPKHQIILYSIFGVVAILVIILLFGIFRSLRSNQFTHEQIIKAKDQTIEVIIEGREKDNLLSVEKDKLISHLLKNDSIRDANYLQSQNVYKKINDKISNIPAYIKRISNNDDSIKHAFANFR